MFSSNGALNGLLTAIAVLGLGGCLQTEETVRLLPSGAGSIGQTWTLDTADRDRLVRAAIRHVTGAVDLPEIPAADPLARKWFSLQARGVDGYRIRRLEEGVSETAQSVQLEASFTNLEAAARAGAFWLSGMRLENRKGRWRFTCWDAWEPAASSPCSTLTSAGW